MGTRSDELDGDAGGIQLSGCSSRQLIVSNQGFRDMVDVQWYGTGGLEFLAFGEDDELVTGACHIAHGLCTHGVSVGEAVLCTVAICTNEE